MLPILCMYFVNYTLISSVNDHLHIKLGTLTSSIFLVNASEVCCISVAVSCRVGVWGPSEQFPGKKSIASYCAIMVKIEKK